MSFSLGNEGLHPFGKNLAEQLDATRHMRQTQIDDVSCWRYGFIGSAKTNFVAIEIRSFDQCGVVPLDSITLPGGTFFSTQSCAFSRGSSLKRLPTR